MKPNVREGDVRRKGEPVSTLLRRSVYAGQESASAGAPSGAGRTVFVRQKPHLPRIFELIGGDGLLNKTI